MSDLWCIFIHSWFEHRASSCLFPLATSLLRVSRMYASVSIFFSFRVQFVVLRASHFRAVYNVHVTQKITVLRRDEPPVLPEVLNRGSTYRSRCISNLVCMYLLLCFCLSFTCSIHHYTFGLLFHFVCVSCAFRLRHHVVGHSIESRVSRASSVIRRPRRFAPAWFSPSKIQNISQQTFVRCLRTTAQLGKNIYSFGEQHPACSG